MIQPQRLRPKRRLLRAQLAAQRAIERDMTLGAAAARAAIGNPIANASPHYQQHYARQYGSNPPNAIPGYPAPLPAPIGMGQSAPPTGWQTATFFDTRPGIARRWYQLLKPGTGGLPIPGYWPIPGTPSTPQQFYTAILFQKNGAEQRYVIVEIRAAGQGKVQAKFYREVPGGWDPSHVPTWPPPGWPQPPGPGPGHGPRWIGS